MTQSFSMIYIHLIFSTKHRKPFMFKHHTITYDEHYLWK